MPFLNELEVKPTFNRPGYWTLTRPLFFRTRDGYRVEVPQGYETNLASIPRLLQGIVQVNGRHRAAAVVHDFLYDLRGCLPYRQFSRQEADDIFLDAMVELGVPRLRRRIMFLAVVGYQNFVGFEF